MATSDAGLELPIGLTEQKFMQQLARIEARAIKTANRSQQGFVSGNKAIGESFGQMSRQSTAALQNVSFQLQDIFVQISSGQGVSRALGQQLPQLLSGFGAMGAAMGLAASLAIPLAASLFSIGDSAEDVSKKIEALESAVKSYSDAAGLATTPTAELVAKFGAAAGAARELYTQIAFLAQLQAMENLKAGMAAVASQFGEVENRVRTIAAEMSLGLTAADAQGGVIRGAIQGLKDDFGLTVEQAQRLVDLVAALEGAQGVNAQAVAAQDLSRFLAEVVRQGGDIPPQMLEGARATAEAAVAALELQAATQEAADAAANVAGQAASIDFSGAIAGANSLAAALARASSAAAVLSTHGVFVGSDGSIQTNRTGQRDPSTNWRFEDPNKDYDTLAERRAREAEAAARAAEAAARRAGGGGGRQSTKGSGGRKSGGGGGASGKAERPFFEDIERDLANLQRQIELVGKSNEEVATAKARWELLDEAKKRGVPVNAALTAQIDAQAAQVGRLTGELERAEIAQDQFDDAIDGIAGAMSNALVEGESLREGLAQVFKGIAADILKSGIRNALMQTFGSMSGGGGGNIFGAIFGGLGGGPAPSFAGGGYTGSGARAGGIDGRGGFPAILHPNETVIDHTKRQTAGGGNMSININLAGANGDEAVARIARASVLQGLASYDHSLPGRVNQIRRDPRAR